MDFVIHQESGGPKSPKNFIESCSLLGFRPNSTLVVNTYEAKKLTVQVSRKVALSPPGRRSCSTPISECFLSLAALSRLCFISPCSSITLTRRLKPFMTCFPPCLQERRPLFQAHELVIVFLWHRQPPIRGCRYVFVLMSHIFSILHRSVLVLFFRKRFERSPEIWLL